MIINLIPDYNLRGYAFEYISKVLLRRTKKNNFIFQTNQFDNIQEIITKYCFSTTNPKISEVLLFIQKEGLRGDLIEFIIEIKENKRYITNILFYDVKTKYKTIKKNYFEMCESNFKFFRELTKKGFSCSFISIVLFESWKFSCTIIPFHSKIVKIYSRFKK